MADLCLPLSTHFHAGTFCDLLKCSITGQQARQQLGCTSARDRAFLQFALHFLAWRRDRTACRPLVAVLGVNCVSPRERAYPDLRLIDATCAPYAALQGWDALSGYPHIVQFLEAMKSRDSWGPSAPVNDEAVANGWKQKLEKMKSS